MFRGQVRHYANFLLGADVMVTIPSLYAAYCSRTYLLLLGGGDWSRFFNLELLPFRDYLLYLLIFLPVWSTLLVLTQRYSRLLRIPLGKQFMQVVLLLIASGFLMGFLSYSFKLVISRPVLFGSLVVAGVLLGLNRVVLRSILRSRNLNEHNQIKMLVVGTDDRAHRVGELLESYKMWGYDVVGYLSAGAKPGDLNPSRREGLLGGLEDLPRLLHEEGVVIDEILFVGLRQKDLDRFQEIIQLCQDLGIRTRLAVDFFPRSTARVSLEFLESLPLLTFSTVPDHSFELIAKRVIDFVLAAVVLIVLSPLLILTAVLVKFTSAGPALYRQVRYGLYGRKFELVKFRTMVDGAEDRLWEIQHLNEMDGPVFKMRDDPRVTLLGRSLRKLSIDELPQLWNVIKGEMSLVGPRAPLVEEVRNYSTKQRRRLSVKPGITCLWQISGRNEIDFERWMDLDLQYIDHWSLWLDLRILAQTIPAVFTGRGAR